ncbi:hypothetical protein ACFYXM_08205 [Streptomyces sp. NPDC002476]|uniref:hypothetical protein n=1 Tax=Streptomyces sp. NPDC002476 TaxID=3364648 RepID=UPI00367DE8BE
MTGLILVEAYAGDGRTALCLGGVPVASPRLALRWLRGQAERLADGLDLNPGTPWTPPYGLQRVPLSIPDAPAELRAWSVDDARQGEALHQLAAGAEFEFITRDEVGWYGLTARPLPVTEFMRTPGE